MKKGKILMMANLNGSAWTHVPNEYNLESVNNFLTTSFFVTADDEMIDSGAEKPGKKGRQLYNSSKIQFCETTKTATLTWPCC
jgi:hypothetical protein